VFVLVIGGGKVGYYLTKELIGSGHEVVLMEKDRERANQIADEIGSIVIAHDGCEGKYLAEAGANRADIVAAVTGDDEDNLVICQMAKHHFDVPRTIARVNNPKNEELFKHLGVDELISPTRMILGSIEQDIPVHELLHLAALGEGELELIEAHLQAGSPAIGRAPKDLSMPQGCSLFAVIRDGVATPLRSDTILNEGDKVIAIGKAECEALLREQLIGDTEPVPAGSSSQVRRSSQSTQSTPVSSTYACTACPVVRAKWSAPISSTSPWACIRSRTCPFTSENRRAAFMSGSTSCTSSNGARTCTSNISRNRFSGKSATGET